MMLGICSFILPLLVANTYGQRGAVLDDPGSVIGSTLFGFEVEGGTQGLPLMGGAGAGPDFANGLRGGLDGNLHDRDSGHLFRAGYSDVGYDHVDDTVSFGESTNNGLAFNSLNSDRPLTSWTPPILAPPASLPSRGYADIDLYPFGLGSSMPAAGVSLSSRSARTRSRVFSPLAQVFSPSAPAGSVPDLSFLPPTPLETGLTNKLSAWIGRSNDEVRLFSRSVRPQPGVFSPPAQAFSPSATAFSAPDPALLPPITPDTGLSNRLSAWIGRSGSSPTAGVVVGSTVQGFNDSSRPNAGSSPTAGVVVGSTVQGFNDSSRPNAGSSPTAGVVVGSTVQGFNDSSRPNGHGGSRADWPVSYGLPGGGHVHQHHSVTGDHAHIDDHIHFGIGQSFHDSSVGSVSARISQSISMTPIYKPQAENIVFNENPNTIDSVVLPRLTGSPYPLAHVSMSPAGHYDYHGYGGHSFRSQLLSGRTRVSEWISDANSHSINAPWSRTSVENEVCPSKVCECWTSHQEMSLV